MTHISRTFVSFLKTVDTPEREDPFIRRAAAAFSLCEAWQLFAVGAALCLVAISFGRQSQRQTFSVSKCPTSQPSIRLPNRDSRRRVGCNFTCSPSRRGRFLVLVGLRAFMTRAVAKAMENFQRRLATNIAETSAGSAGPGVAASTMGGSVADLVHAVRAVCCISRIV
jgi:hypothetical protein